MNTPTEPELLSIRHGMEYLMHHPHKNIMYPKKKMFKTNDIPHQCFLKGDNSEINKNNEYSNFIHIYCDADNSIDLSERNFVT